MVVEIYNDLALAMVEKSLGGLGQLAKEKRELTDNTVLAKQDFAISLLTWRLLSTRAIISSSNCLTIVPY